MTAVILIEPTVPGNIGAIARVMQNFECTELTLINPKCNHLSKEAQDRAKHAKEILKQAKTIKKLEEAPYDYLIATTSQLGKDYNITRLPILPKQLTQIIPNNKNIAIVFGREGEGMHNNEIETCDMVCTIPTSKKKPTMNISHATAIILYELFQTTKENVTSHITLATKEDKKRLMQELDKALSRMKTSQERKTIYKKIWKRMAARFIPRREVMALYGFLKKIK
ncbi:RNA methyltransferase [Candidatus Woesearchaeota archaeon]|nr:RNA methyltransferase [Candidatus Woesearchaeota archaeon]